MNTNLKIPFPLHALKIPERPDEPPSDGSPTREAILSALQALQERGPKLAPRRGKGTRVQYRLRPREAQLLKTTNLGLDLLAGRPLTQSLALRVALVRLASAVSVALRDADVAAVLRADIAEAHEAALEP